MKKILIIGIIAVCVVGGYFFLRGDTEVGVDVKDRTVTGVVTQVSLEAVMFDGPALITIRDADELIHTIAVPSMGILLCPANSRIASPFDAEVGDRVSVRGSVDEEGRITPCASEDHFLTLTADVVNENAQFAFTYTKGREGLVLINTSGSTHIDFVSGVMLMDKREYELLQASTDAREGPPAITVSVYKNPKDLSPREWALENTLESNSKFAMGDITDVTLAGLQGVQYTADGLYPMDTIVTTHGAFILLLSGAYIDPNDGIKEAFNSILSSFRVW